MIKRHDRAIARLVHETRQRQAELKKAKGEIEAFRRTMPRLNVEEIRAARHEGHKY